LLVHGVDKSSISFIGETVLSHWVFLTGWSNVSWSHVRGFVSGSLLFHWPIWLFSFQYHHHFDYSSFVTYFKIRSYNTFSFLLAQNCFDYSGSLWFHMNFRIFTIYVKNTITILIESTWICRLFGVYGHFNNISFSYPRT
jgi:hypothetical protein